MRTTKEIELLNELTRQAINKGAELANAPFFFGKRPEKYKELCQIIVEMYQLAAYTGSLSSDKL